MLKKTITYTDYNDTVCTEEFCFNINKAELVDLETEIEGGMEALLKRVIEEQDVRKIIEIFKDIVLRSFGVKSEDGKYFRKTPELREAFSQTEAYSEIFMELAGNAELASAFMTGILPKSMGLPAGASAAI